MLTHLGLVVWLSIMTSRLPLSADGLIFFGTGIVWTYLMAILSFGDLWKVLGSMGSRTLRLVGVNYILIAFALDFLPAGIHGIVHHDVRRLVAYAPFAAMSVAAPLLVFAAAVHHRLGIRYDRAEFGTSLNLN